MQLKFPPEGGVRLAVKWQGGVSTPFWTIVINETVALIVR